MVNFRKITEENFDAIINRKRPEGRRQMLFLRPGRGRTEIRKEPGKQQTFQAFLYAMCNLPSINR